MFILFSIFLILFFIFWFFIFQRGFSLFIINFVNILCLFCMLLCIHICLYFLVFFCINIQCCICLFILVDLLNLNWFFFLDIISCLLLYVVFFISFFVNFYSIDYMFNDPHYLRYFSYLALFCFFMIILIISFDFIQFFLGWEGVGLCSYLLISFWSTRLQASKASIKAMLTNRVGDFGLMLSFIFIYNLNKSLCFNIILFNSFFFKLFFFNFFNFFSLNILSICCLFLFIGAMGKSAQLFLHIWLPDAMEGPTPVSALIHAATMVTAGVFLIVRCSFLFELCPFILFFIMFIGICTAFFAGTVGIVQNDLKRIIAFSTCSQLGYMICSCGLSGYFISFFHLFNHAFFKALLFLCAGCIIHILNDEQDLRKMGGLLNVLPFIYIIFFIGTLALIGFPFLSGFYSKDLLLEIAYSKYTFNGFFVFWLGTLSAFFTSFYSFRLLIFTFYSKSNINFYNFINIHEVSFFLGFPLFCLGFFSIFFGFLFKDIFVGFGSDILFSSIFVLFSNIIYIDFEFLPIFIKIMPLFFSFLGIFFSFFFYFFFYKNIFYIFNINLFYYYLFYFLSRRWFFDKFFNEIINQYFLIYSFSLFFCNIDRGFLEDIGSYFFFFNFSDFFFFLSFLNSFFFFDFIFIYLYFFFNFLIFFYYFYFCIFYIYIYIFFFIFYFCIF